MGYNKFPPYVTVKEKKARAEKKLKQLRKKAADIHPVAVDGRTLARTWWGKAWNRNLERYADFVNRIGRGRSYLRHGAVLDLRIEPGQVRALVQGSDTRPYSVTIRINALSQKNWKDIRGICAGRIDSMTDLLEGRFPESLSEVFTARGQGLFPSPQEIKFDCNCPDWADMCKHVAATLYGIGARLDEDPALFFVLRKVKVEDLVSAAMAETTERLLNKAKETSEQVIADADLSDVFGIVMEDQLDFGNAKPSAAERARAVEKKAGRKKAPVPAPRKKKKGPVDELDRILKLIENAAGGIAVPALAAMTGLSAARVRNIVYGACKKGLIQKAGRGLFTLQAKTSDTAREAEAVLALVAAAPRGIRIADVQKETNLPDMRVRNIIARAHAQGAIQRLARGVYGVKKEKPVRGTATDEVLEAIENAAEGVGVSALCDGTGLEEKKLRNILFRLFKLGKIKRIGWGVYAAAK